jgi:dTDP-4-dehydrorhamnose reductase
MPHSLRRFRPIELRFVHYRALPRLFRRRRLLVIGCGDIGQRLASLCAGRWRVFGVARSPETLDGIRAAGAVPLSAEGSGRRLQDLADWVVHSAPPPSGGGGGGGDNGRSGALGDGGEIDRLTRQWIARLLQRRQPPQGVGRNGGRRDHAGRDRVSLDRSGRKQAATASSGRLVYLSTTGVYGDRNGHWTDEVSAVAPITDRARRRVDAERSLRDAARRAGSLRVSTLRVPGIYAIDRLPVSRLEDRVPALLPEDDVQTNHIEANDLARAINVALLRFRNQRTINVVDDSSLALGDYLDLVARWSGLPLPPRVDRQTLLQTVSPMRASFMNESRRLSNRRMKEELRLRLRYPTVEAFLAAHPRAESPT